MTIICPVASVSITLTLVPPNEGKFQSFCSILTPTTCGSVNHFMPPPFGDVELKDWEYEPIFTKDVDSNTVEIKLQQVPPEDLREDILSYATETKQEGSKTKQ